MNTSVLIKESRPLFLPWCAVMLTGLVSLIRPLHSIGWIGLLGIVLGVPLLATLPLGNEFQHRTLSLLLSQPVGRAKIWIAKSSIAFVAVATVVSVFAFSPLVAETLPNRSQQANALALALAVLCSATFWTLIARSTIGGIALSVGTVLLIAGFSTIATGFGAKSLFLMTHFTAASAAIPLCYAALMLWLGARMLVRYQVTGTMAGDDLLTAGSNLMLGAFSNRAYANPTRPVLNLIRKELRLLRPIWLLTLLTASAWTCFAVVYLLRQHDKGKGLSLPIIAFGLSSAAIIAILSGCLSLGEEKTSGTYAWHRTLPISAARQWSIKLFVALFVSFVCAGLIPILLLTAGKHLFPSAYHLDADFQIFWLLGELFLTLLSFWCACAVNGTVTAVAWIVPILAFVTVMPQIANWAGRQFTDLVVLKLSLFANLRVAISMSNLSSRAVSGLINPINLNAISAGQLLFWVPTLVLAVVQSYRMFCAPIQDSPLAVARKLSPLVGVALLCGFFMYGLRQFSSDAEFQVYGGIYSVENAIQSVLSDSANRDSVQPLQLTAGDLKKAYPAGAHTSSWLNDATLTIVPDKAHPTTCCKSPVTGRPLGRPWWNYSATVHLASGAELNLSFEPPAERPTGPPKRRAVIRWPGSTSEQILH